MTLTLWDLIEPIRRKLRPPPPRIALPPAAPDRARVNNRAGGGAVQAPPAAPRRRPPRHPAPVSSRPRRPAPAPQSAAGMQARYDRVVALMLERYEVRVRKWRTSMSGVAWYVTYRDGSRQNLIEAPRPRGPMSIAVFLHEIGHHAIGFDVYKPRCLEEYHAWRWALEAMQAHGLNITEAVHLRVHRSLNYAVEKAKRRGIKVIPPELTPYLVKPPRRRPRR